MSFELSNPPSDGISSLKFSPTDPNLLILSSWDKTARLYNVQNDTELWVAHHKVYSNNYIKKAAVLDVCFLDHQYVCTGSLDKSVRIIDISNGTDQVVGKHEQAVKAVCYSSEVDAIFSGSWDKTIRIWDPKSSGQTPQSSVSLPQKVFSMDMIGNQLVVAMSGRAIHVYDIRNMKEPSQTRESALKFMTRIIRCMPNGEGYASGSIEGRIAVEFFDPSPESQSRKYAFKCHRQQIDNIDTVYPVNALSFHPVHGTFASGGGDGVVSVWDGINKKRIKQIAKYPTSISSLSFNSYGSYLAIASSYTFEEGEKDHPPDSVTIHSVSENEVKPKNKN